MGKPKNEKLATFIEEVKNADASGATVLISTAAAIEAMTFIENKIQAASKGGSRSKRKPIKLDRASESNRRRSKKYYDSKKKTQE